MSRNEIVKQEYQADKENITDSMIIDFKCGWSVWLQAKTNTVVYPGFWFGFRVRLTEKGVSNYIYTKTTPSKLENMEMKRRG